MFAIQCWWAPRRTKQLSNVAILLYRFLSCWCLSRSISLADYCLSLHIFLADQISCKSHVGIVYRMRSLTVSRFSTLKGIRVLNKRSVSYGGNLCPLWLEILKLVWHRCWRYLTASKQLAVSCIGPYSLFAAVPWNGLKDWRRKRNKVMCLF